MRYAKFHFVAKDGFSINLPNQAQSQQASRKTMKILTILTAALFSGFVCRCLKVLLILPLFVLAGCSQKEVALSELDLKERNPNGIVFVSQDITESKKAANEEWPLGCKCYKFALENVHPQDTFHLVAENLSGKMLYGKFCYREEKFLQIDNSELFDIDIVLGQHQPGEPFAFYLISEDKKTCLKLEIVPNPIQVVASDGAEIKINTVDPKWKIFCFRGKGFKPHEVLQMKGVSYNEPTNIEIQATSEGKLIGILLPEVSGKTGGLTQIQFIRNTDEILETQFHWGVDARKKPSEYD